MEFVVEAASIAHGIPVGITSPQRRCRRSAVGTTRSCSPCSRLEIENNLPSFSHYIQLYNKDIYYKEQAKPKTSTIHKYVKSDKDCYVPVNCELSKIIIYPKSL